MKLFFISMSAILICACSGCQFSGVRKWSLEVQAPGASVKISADVDGFYTSSGKAAKTEAQK
jgi:hypothetical protein